MTSKFNVGDKVEVIGNGAARLAIGTKAKVKEVKAPGVILDKNNIVGNPAFYLYKNIKLVKSKNQRITALEETVSKQVEEINELKVIVHQLRKPSTIQSVEDIIEFEGNQYKKVDREAREGDVVIFNDVGNSDFFKVNVPYKVLEGMKVKGSCIYRYDVYTKEYNRTLETVDVYELIKEGFNPQIPIADEAVELSPNQQRAAIIEKAKKFVEGNGEGFTFDLAVENTVTAFRQNWINGKVDMQFGAAYCNPSDVFNEHIGKAIALGRALGFDVSEFENAVQPTVAIGQIITNKHWEYEVLTTEDKDGNLKLTDSGGLANGGDLPNRDWYTIINDTNAQYEVTS